MTIGVKWSHQDFVLLMRDINPNINIIGKYTKALDKILVSDELGILYNIKACALLRGTTPSINSAINKTECFKTKLKHVQPNLQVLGEYIKGNVKIEVIDEFNLHYLSTPESLLRGDKPTVVSSINKNLWFITHSNIKHKNKYNYSISKYSKLRDKIKIICPEHGIFEQNTLSHLSGNGCPKCSISYGWKCVDWVNSCIKNNKEPLLYIIRCFNKNENFIKIGITSNSVFERFKSNMLPYSYEILKEIKGSPDFVWNKEKELHKLCKSSKYKPLISFPGESECFTLNCLSLLDIV